MAVPIAFSADFAGTVTIQRLDRADLAGLGELLAGGAREGGEAPSKVWTGMPDLGA